MDYQAVEEVVKVGYRKAAPRYRSDDEIEVTTKNHRHLSKVLREVCLSFGRPIRVLDVGCGTGRYFHCLKNVEALVGIDISEEMLAAAKHPVRAEEITVKQIQLARANAYLSSFPAAGFDFIFSLGMFGHGCPVTVEICDKFHTWLKPGGKLFFNTVDTAGLPVSYRLRRRLRRVLYPLLTQAWKATLDERDKRWPFFSLTKAELAALLSRTCFRAFTLTSHRCESPLWKGRHLECLATKTPPEASGEHVKVGATA
jgi:SAM-dependent methyltransferase